MQLDSLTLLFALAAGAVSLLGVAFVLAVTIRRTVDSALSLPILAVLCAIAFLLVHKDTFAGGNLAIVPDSVEYAAGARSLWKDGEFSIQIEGRQMPPRYLPWFSLFGISPVFLLGDDIGLALHAVTAWAIVCVVCAFGLGSRVGGLWGGTLAAAGLMILPGFRYYSRVVMSEIPNAAVSLLACSLYLELTNKKGAHGKKAMAAGLLVALASCFRPPSAALVLPFVLTFIFGARSFLAAASVVAPVALVAVASFRYNASVFGSISRSGYNFWSPVPYDYPHLALSLSYVGDNLGLLVYNTLAPAMLLVLAFLFLHGAPQMAKLFDAIDRTALERICRFTVFGIFPIVLLYLPYFYSNTRFYFVFEVFTVVTCGAVMGGLVKLQKLPHWMAGGWAVAVLTVMVIRPELYGGSPPIRRIAAERIRSSVPEGAMVVSGLDPVYLEAVANQGRRFVPISRRIEYASKLIARKRIENPIPPPSRWNDHRASGLKDGGAEEAVDLVALEDPHEIEAVIDSDVPTFLDASAITPEEMGIIAQTFALELVAEDLYKLSLPPSILEE